MSEESVVRNKRNFRRLQEEVIVGGDVSLVPELMAPHMRVLRGGDDSFLLLGGRQVPEGRVITQEQFIQQYRATVGEPKVHRRTITAMHGEGDVVWARWTIEEQHDSGRYGVPPTGKVLTVEEVAMVRFDDEGRMVEGWFMRDPVEVLTQIGAKVTVEPAAAE
ncbi:MULTISPECIES: ester cyclase [Streptomyces]|uniref:ester cyclase n=1 Tax=Streptomyces lycopersici TaxID=2974589 RepID=UPI0021D3D236|nr:ester cyclase [Streptomyces sp. NEAU-383]